jgi:CelD/BcsL family acetyltransferase involved in cellulose biosynthesis
LQISRIDDMHEYERLKPHWKAAYLADPHAHVFVSWAWLRGWFEATSNDWLVLAFRPDEASPFAAFLPLSLRQTQFGLTRELQMGGSPLADYTGFVCLPGYEEQAIGAFGQYVRENLEWDIFHVKDVMDRRLDRFLAPFRREAYSVEHVENIPCPYIDLPSSSWEQYLLDFLSVAARRNVRRYTKKTEALDQFRVTSVQKDNLDSQIEALLKLWQMRWGSSPFGHRTIFRRCFEEDNLWLTVFWQRNDPVSAAVAFVDRPKGTFAGFLTCYDERFSSLSPGTVLIAHSIKYALENGFRVYDFLRGDEPYKYAFGAKDRFCTYHRITRKSPRSTAVVSVKNVAKQLLEGYEELKATVTQKRGGKIGN